MKEVVSISDKGLMKPDQRLSVTREAAAYSSRVQW